MVIVYGAGGPGGPKRLPRSMPAESYTWNRSHAGNIFFNRETIPFSA